MEAGWFYSPRQIGRYLATRVSSLKPPKVRTHSFMTVCHCNADYDMQNKLRNPISILRELTVHQWLMFAAGFMGWTWDAFDFFTVSMTITEISVAFNVSYAAVSWVSHVNTNFKIDP